MPEILSPDPPLSDAIVALRRWSAADVPEAIMGFADPSVLRRSWAETRPYTEADAREFFAHQAHAWRAGGELCFAFTEPLRPAAVIGGGSLHDLDLVHARAAVGYWVAPAARGRGVATHATRLMAGWAFGTLGVQRLELTTAPDNAASQRVAVKAGFTREGRLRSHLAFRGGRRDTVMFSLLPGEARACG